MFNFLKRLMGTTFSGGVARPGEGSTATEDDAGGVGNSVDTGMR